MKGYCFVAVVCLLSGCTAAPHMAYEQDKTPENRRYYKGVNGYKQFVKDEAYLVQKEQNSRCQQYLFSLLMSTGQPAGAAGPPSGLRGACTGVDLETIRQLEVQVKSP